jgi:hypothetical protein
LPARTCSRTTYSSAWTGAPFAMPAQQKSSPPSTARCAACVRRQSSRASFAAPARSRPPWLRVAHRRGERKISPSSLRPLHVLCPRHFVTSFKPFSSGTFPPLVSQRYIPSRFSPLLYFSPLLAPLLHIHSFHSLPSFSVFRSLVLLFPPSLHSVPSPLFSLFLLSPLSSLLSPLSYLHFSPLPRRGRGCALESSGVGRDRASRCVGVCVCARARARGCRCDGAGHQGV